MARIPYPVEDDIDPDTRSLLEKLPPLNLFRLMAGAGQLLPAFGRLGNYVLAKSSLDPMVRELVIIRVGVVSEAHYEVHQHEALARRLGMSDEVVAAVHEGPGAAALDDFQRALLRFTDEVVADVRASDEAFEAVRAGLTDHQLQDLTMTIGFYMMVSRYLRTFDVEVEGETT